MKTSITCLLLALSLTAPALAETLKFPADKPVASITFPDDWEAEVTGDMIVASNEDGDVLINVITTSRTCSALRTTKRSPCCK